MDLSLSTSSNLLALPPGIWLLVGAALVALVPGPNALRNGFAALLALATLGIVLHLPDGIAVSVPFLDRELQWLRVDALSRTFGVVFSLAACCGFVFALQLADRLQTSAAMAYIGSALTAIYAGDLLTLYLGWEIMAIASTFLVLAGNTPASLRAAKRYILVHILGGLMLLAGLVMHVGSGGSLTFDAFSTTMQAGAATWAAWLILAGFLVNAAAPPLSSWMPDAYARASLAGGVFLSAFTSKTAVYAILRGFPAWEPLIYMGLFMAAYGLIYAWLENDMRRILAYAIINQVGFMVAAAGLGTPLALSGGAANAFGHILYKSLLWMAVGSLIVTTGRTHLSELRAYRLTAPQSQVSLQMAMIWLVLGGLASALPFTAGATGKAPLLDAFSQSEHFWAWLALQFMAAGAFIALALRLPYFLFFPGKGKAPSLPAEKRHVTGVLTWNMHVAMALMALLCLFFGVFAQTLYDLLPHAIEKSGGLAALASKLLVLVGAGTVFWVLRPFFQPRLLRLVDFDWIYRYALPRILRWLSKSYRKLEARLLAMQDHLVQGAGHVDLALRLVLLVVAQKIWREADLSEKRLAIRRRVLPAALLRGFLPLGLLALPPALFLALLFLK